MKLDAETLRKLALTGARSEKRELEQRLERVNEYIRQLTGASIAEKMSPKRQPGQPKRRKRRAHTEAFKAKVVREANEADNASAIGKKHNLSPSLVRLWQEKSKK